jgi:MFS transporter, MHS family, proline/betaine transporter
VSKTVVTVPAQFPTEVRCGGLSISFNIFVSAFAGTTSLIMSALVPTTGWAYWPALYLIFAGLVGVAAVVKLVEPGGRPLMGSNAAVATVEGARELAASGVGHHQDTHRAPRSSGGRAAE